MECLRRTFLCLMAAAGIALPGAGDVGYDIEEMALRFSFNSHRYGHGDLEQLGLPSPCMSFLRLQDPAKRRPLFVTGFGRRGDLLLDLKQDTFDETTYETKAITDAVVAYSTYGSSGRGDPAVYSAGGLLAERPPIIMEITALGAVKETTRHLRRFLRYQRALGKEEPPPPPPVIACTMDVTLKVGERRVTLASLPTTIELRYEQQFVWGRGKPYWKALFRSTGRIKGADLGLAGDDAGELEVTILCGAVTRAPEAVVSKAVGDDDIQETKDAIHRLRMRMSAGASTGKDEP